jgi:hypothetical protein
MHHVERERSGRLISAEAVLVGWVRDLTSVHIFMRFNWYG